MMTLIEYIKEQYIKEALEKKIINNLEVTYSSVKSTIYIDAPETYQEEDIHQYIDDLLLNQMPSDQDIAKKYFAVNVKYINDAYFELGGFERLEKKLDDVDVEYDSSLGKSVPEDVDIVTFKITDLQFKMLFSQFEMMLDDETDVQGTLDDIFSAYESNAYNDHSITFKYDSCEYDT